MRIPDLHEEVDLKAYRTYHDPILAGQEILSEAKILRKDGSKVDAEFSNRRIVIKGVPFMHTTARDITERRRAEESVRLDSEIMANMADGVYLIRASDGVIVHANPQFEKMFGYDSGELIGKHVSIVNAPGATSPQAAAEEIIQALKQNGVWHGEVHNIKKDGMSPFWCNASVSTFMHPDHGTVWISVHQDITARKQAEEGLHRAQAAVEEAHRELQQEFAREQHLARTDAHTGVNNRRYWFELAEHEFEVATRYHHPLSVILFDLDHFKLVNDTFGHAVGDQVLERVAHVARTALRSADVIGRYGGEEFVIVLPVTTAFQAYPVAERIRASVGAIKVETARGQAAVTLSIGIAETLLAPPTERPGGDDSVERVISRADDAMYAAKQAGGNRTTTHSAPTERPGGST